MSRILKEKIALFEGGKKLWEMTAISSRHHRTASTPADLKWYRVQLNTVVRSGKDLDSERIRILPMGTRVRVQEILKRRVRIDMPVKGWCSMRSAGGDIILKPIEDGEENLTTPSFGKSAENKADLLRKKIQDVRIQQQQAKLKLVDANSNKIVRSLAEKHSKLMKIVQNKLAAESSELSSPRAMKAKLLHTQSCMSKLEIEHSAKNMELDVLQNQLGNIQAQLSNVCKKQGVENPLELTAQIEKMENDQEMAKEKIMEYQSVTKRYEREIFCMKEKLASLLQKEPVSLKSSYVIKNVEIHNGDVVLMKDNVGIVIVHYIGHVHWSEDEIYVGVELGEPVGSCNGTVEGKTYFSVGCDRGAFFPLSEISRKIPAASLLKQLQKQVEKNDRLLSSKE